MTESLVPAHDRVQYSDNVSQLLQDKGGKLVGGVMVDMHKGKQASVVDQYGIVEMKAKNGQRFTPIEFSDIPHTRRWVVPQEYDLAIPVDDFDKLRTISDPTNTYVELGRKAIARKEDAIIFAAFFSTAKVGEMGGDTETFNTTSYRIAAGVGGGGSDVGLNVAKIKAAITIFLEAEVDFDDESNQRFMAITPAENEQLLDEVQVVNSDYRGEKPVLDGDGRVRSYLGVNFIVFASTTFVKNGMVVGANRTLPCWVKSGMHLGRFDPAGHGPMSVDISQRKDLKGHPYQIYFDMAGGATRLEAGKVIQILSKI